MDLNLSVKNEKLLPSDLRKSFNVKAPLLFRILCQDGLGQTTSPPTGAIGNKGTDIQLVTEEN